MAKPTVREDAIEVSARPRTSGSYAQRWKNGGDPKSSATLLGPAVESQPPAEQETTGASCPDCGKSLDYQFGPRCAGCGFQLADTSFGTLRERRTVTMRMNLALAIALVGLLFVALLGWFSVSNANAKADRDKRLVVASAERATVEGELADATARVDSLEGQLASKEGQLANANSALAGWQSEFTERTQRTTARRVRVGEGNLGRDWVQAWAPGRPEGGAVGRLRLRIRRRTQRRRLKRDDRGKWRRKFLQPQLQRLFESKRVDYDCSGGSGDGPYYTGTVQVIGYDEYGLDANGNGWGCE